MSKKVIFQGITEDSHIAAVKHVLDLDELESVKISVAFLNKRGVYQLRDSLEKCATKATVFAGIRNGITSAQGLNEIIDIGCTLYAVDTGSRSTLFHPKVYLASSLNTARMLIGSANMTVGGLQSNIEASIQMHLDLTNEADKGLVDDMETKLTLMLENFPDHIIHVQNHEKVVELFETGRVVDESIVVAPAPRSASSKREADSVPKIKLNTATIKKIKVESQEVKTPTTGATAPTSAKPVAPHSSEKLELLWESNPLTRRYLDIPTGSNTHATGSMLFTKGAMDDIDQRHYFRDEVFGNLNWQNDTSPQKAHMERAEAQFQIVIRGVDYSIHTLRLSHNSRTDTKSYQQNNSMTQLHWGEARSLIAREDLLDRTMLLYRNNSQPNLYILEID